MDVILFDLARPGTPGNNSAVFGVVLQQGAKLAVIGTAFAVNQKLAISAWHNFIESNFQTGDVVYLCKELCQGIILKSSPQVNVREYDVIEDWVVMELISGDFSSHVTLCKEGELPTDEYPVDSHGSTISIGKDVGVRDFPYGLIDSTERVSIGSMTGKIYNYSPLHTDRKYSDQLILADSFPTVVNSILNIRGGRVLGSCGAPYFGENGKVIAFHVSSCNDADTGDMKSTSGHRHASYSAGHVLCRLPKFAAKYNSLL